MTPIQFYSHDNNLAAPICLLLVLSWSGFPSNKKNILPLLHPHFPQVMSLLYLSEIHIFSRFSYFPQVKSPFALCKSRVSVSSTPSIPCSARNIIGRIPKISVFPGEVSLGGNKHLGWCPRSRTQSWGSHNSNF